jgi:AcrR family transcriptional regulator
MASTKAIEKSAASRNRGASPRVPSRGRGVRRYAALLDATSELLLTEAPDAIGLYQIAERAGVPPASVYHFFPTKEAAYVALASRCCEELLEVHRRPIEARSIKSWQDLYRIDVRRAMEFYNSYPPYLKIIYGGYGGVDAHNVDKVLALFFSSSSYDRFDRIFHMPAMSEPEKKFEIRVGILDSVWQISVRRHGRITEEYFEESVKAAIAYSRLYLPDHLEPRPFLVEAAERGATIELPYDQDGSEATLTPSGS